MCQFTENHQIWPIFGHFLPSILKRKSPRGVKTFGNPEVQHVLTVDDDNLVEEETTAWR